MVEMCAAACAVVSVAVRECVVAECERVDGVLADVNVAGPIVSWDQMNRDSLDELCKRKRGTTY